jgi:hypothetical protein
MEVGGWQGGMPLVLDNAEPALAVALGAAQSRLFDRQARAIVAGAGRAVFLEVQAAAATVVCILPRGAAPEQVFEVATPGLELRTGRLVRFQAYSSARDAGSRPGDILVHNDDDFHPLPPLQTTAEADGERSVPVRLAATMNALGLLQVSCVSTDPALSQSWPLEFNLRPHDRAAAFPVASVRIDPNASTEAQEAARQRLGSAFTPGRGKPAKASAGALFKNVEGILGMPRAEWNAALLRGLWPALEQRPDGRKISVDHEEAWLTLAAFLLRPGFGFPGDEQRIDALWRALEAGACFPGRRIRVQEFLLWRRLAGGLNAERQERLLAGGLAALRAGNAPAELVHLAGSLELIAQPLKAELAERFIETATKLARAREHCAPYLAALGLLLNRAPFHAGPETVVPAALVDRAYSAFRGFDWAEPGLVEVQTLFLRAARVVGDRSLDVPKGLRTQIAGKLEKAGVPPLRVAKIQEFVPIGRADQASLYDGSLPPGLVLGVE